MTATLRTMGWAVFIFGIITAVRGFANLLFLVLAKALEVFPGGFATTGVGSFMHRWGGSAGAILVGLAAIIASVGLTRGQEWARRRLIVVGVVLIVWWTGSLADALPSFFHLTFFTGTAAEQALRRQMLPADVATLCIEMLGKVALLILLISWLRSLAVREACRAENIIPPPPLGGKP
jgi:hypothetical protein